MGGYIMSQFSDYYENKIIDHMLRNQSFSPPTTIYLALFTSSTGLESNNPTGEVSGNAYARQAITLSAASGGASENTANITIPTAAPTGWGTITHVALQDHAPNTTWGTNVNVLMWAALTASKAIDAGDIFQINAGDLDITVA
jgi:hypothetical protein